MLTLLSAGHRQAEIACHLVISRKTVATHFSNIFEKLGVHTQAHAVAAAYRLGILSLPAPTASRVVRPAQQSGEEILHVSAIVTAASIGVPITPATLELLCAA